MKIDSTTIAVAAFCRTFKSYSILKSESIDFAQTQQAVFLGLGFFIVAIFAQICGEQAVMRTVLHDNYQRSIGRFVEEIIEFLGYIIVVIGSLECYLQG
jgi:hypothetical protein